MRTLDDAPAEPTLTEPADPFTSNASTINAVVRTVSWRRRLSRDDAQEFAAWVQLRLVERDFAILRKFRGESSLETYLTVVVNRLLLDFRASVSGKFRPSVAARAMGEVGVELERLLIVNKHTLGEALEILRNRGFSFSADELEALAVKLPVRRSQIVFVDPDDLESLGRGSTEIREPQEARTGRHDLLRRLVPLLRALPIEDRLLIRMHFLDGAGIAEIARCLKVDEQPLRRRLRRVLRDLRSALETRGVTRSILKELFP